MSEEKEKQEGQGAPYSRNVGDLPVGSFPSDTPALVGSDGEKEGEDILEGEEQESEEKRTETWLLQKAQEIYTTSTDYMEANITSIWETNLAHFNNQHAPGSRYGKSSYKRSNVFRPRTRANIKNQEANMATAAFSTQELANVEAEDKSNELQVVSAKVCKSLLQYRLQKRMPWFLTVQGAYQDTKNYGVCITHQYWRYHEDTEVLPAVGPDGEIITIEDEDGTFTPMGYENTIVRDDSLHCDNIPPENFRFDPMCDWRDPANTSPYIVYLIPMYVMDVQEMMEITDPKTKRTAWKKYSMSEIISARRQVYDRTRQAREGSNRVDPADQQNSNGYTTVFVHMNIIRVNGDDVVYWTLGTDLILTEAVRLADVFPHLKPGQRPFTVGFSNIETHKTYPAGDNQLSSGIQTEINDVANQRLDNVKLALNKRYYIKRGSQVDLDALIRNVPGGGVMVNDPEKDIKTVETRDVTGSSYQEQDRLAVEMDELVGGFSQSTVNNNGNLGKTVGGMGMAAQSAGTVQDYSIRIFMETWMEPTLRQLMQLIQMYETDETLISLAAKNAGVWERYGVSTITDEILQQELTVNVNIGIGNTDPVRRIEKLVFGVTKSAELPGMIERMKSPAISDEIFGAMGYKDGSRFFMNDEEFAKAQENMPPPGPPPEIEVKLRELEIRQEDNQARHQREMERMSWERDVAFGKLALEKELKLEDVYARLGIEKLKVKTHRDTTALREANKSQELSIKRAEASRPAPTGGKK